MRKLISTTLFFKDQKSDKEYRAAIEEKGEGYVVNFAFGRRGATLQTGTKTNQPVGYDEALTIFEKLVAEKMGKGYTTGEDGTPFASEAFVGKVSDFKCQLLTVAEFDVDAYIRNPAWVALEKFDGERRSVQVNCETGEVKGINRRGLYVPLPESVAYEAGVFGRHFGERETIVLDGELIGDKLHVFDFGYSSKKSIVHPETGEPDALALHECDFELRHKSLDLSFFLNGEYRIISHKAMVLAPMASTEEEKAKLVEEVRGRNGEGIVWKRRCAPYRAGRSLDALKTKFVETASVVVGQANGTKRSVGMLVLDETGRLVDCGNVTIPPNYQIPGEGATVEVSYLYAFSGSGRLFQPVFKGGRTDIEAADCTRSQFKFRPEE
jgi:bifunctional non-homologous end joining protein LigD